jgi:hypothetical protein
MYELYNVGCYMQEGLQFVMSPFCLGMGMVNIVTLCGLAVSVLAIGPKVCGFKLSQGRWIFKGDKNLQNAFLWRGNKTLASML